MVIMLLTQNFSLFLFRVYLSNSSATGTYHLLRHKEIECQYITFNKAKYIFFLQ